MRKLRLIASEKAVPDMKTVWMLLAGICIISLLIPWDSVTAIPALHRLRTLIFAADICILTALIMKMFLFSQYSPVKSLALRSKLVQFTRLFINSKENGLSIYSVEWRYAAKGQNYHIDLSPNGLIKDTTEIGVKLSEYLRKPLLKYWKSDGIAHYIFGIPPKRYDGMNLIGEGISEVTGEYKPKISYKPIPIYDNLAWDFTSEALHILLIAPSGAGKSWFLKYLGGMVLKRQQRLYVIDAKNSDFGRLFRHSGVRVATNTEEILKMLSALVKEMEYRYFRYFASGSADIDADFSTLGLVGHILIFDEILSALNNAGKKEAAEMERLLKQIALKGRAAGFSMVVTAQKLNATDLSKAITEQCQTRIILGSVVSEETFHQATGFYKKDLATDYNGGIGKGYAVTPKSEGLAPVKTPLMPGNSKCVALFKKLRDRGTPCGYGE